LNLEVPPNSRKRSAGLKGVANRVTQLSRDMLAEAIVERGRRLTHF